MYSSYLSTLTSKVSYIRQNLLQSEADGDTPDDTHLCRVLRNYYTDEKKVNLPPWLPPDPRAPPPVIVQPVYSQPGVGSSYGQPQTPQSSGGLSSLWAAQPPPQQGAPMQNGSLRPGRPGLAERPSTSSARLNPFSAQQEAASPRPLPSQKAGSYQSMYSSSGEGGAPMTAAQRLKAKVNRKSPSTNDIHTAARGNSYDSSGSGANYEDRFMPADRGGSAAGSYGGGGEKPYMGASSPWSSSEPEYTAPRQRAPGLPSGPGAGRRVGLPAGPRGNRY